MQNTVPVAEVLSLLKRLNYVVVNNWEESHGDGGRYTLQQQPDPNFGSLLNGTAMKEVSYDRKGNVRDLYDRQDGKNNNYLLAAHVEDEARKADGRWVELPKSYRSSPCHTESSRVYVERYNWSETDTLVTVVSVAGHGSWAHVKYEPASIARDDGEIKVGGC